MYIKVFWMQIMWKKSNDEKATFLDFCLPRTRGYVVSDELTVYDVLKHGFLKIGKNFWNE